MPNDHKSIAPTKPVGVSRSKTIAVPWLAARPGAAGADQGWLHGRRTKVKKASVTLSCILSFLLVAGCTTPTGVNVDLERKPAVFPSLYLQDKLAGIALASVENAFMGHEQDLAFLKGKRVEVRISSVLGIGKEEFEDSYKSMVENKISLLGGIISHNLVSSKTENPDCIVNVILTKCGFENTNQGKMNVDPPQVLWKSLIIAGGTATLACIGGFSTQSNEGAGLGAAAGVVGGIVYLCLDPPVTNATILNVSAASIIGILDQSGKGESMVLQGESNGTVPYSARNFIDPR